MLRRSSRAWADQVCLVGIAGGFSGATQPRPRFAAQRLHVNLAGRAAGLADIPKLPQPVDVFLPKLALELPITNRFADNLTGGGVFASVHGRLQRRKLLAGQRNAHFLYVGHRAPPVALVVRNTTY